MWDEKCEGRKEMGDWEGMGKIALVDIFLFLYGDPLYTMVKLHQFFTEAKFVHRQ